MIVRFWGVRGSLPTPSIANLKYGGNTPCVEVCTNSGQLIILDAGTGIRALGQRLMQEKPPDGHRIMLFLTHYHWDHIQGIPFFEPMYVPGNIIYLHGFKTAQASVESALGDQMANPFFPVDPSVMQATRHLYTIGEETLQVGDAVVKTLFLNHPQGCLGYRIEADGHTIVYATDNEHGSEQHDRNVRELARGADIFIYDTQYTTEEYEAKRGWGHSTWEVGVDIARETGAKNLILFHHDPDHSDSVLDEVLQAARKELPSTIAAFEGLQLDPSHAPGKSRTSFNKRYAARHVVSIPVVVRIRDTGVKLAKTIVANISLDGAYILAPMPIEIGQEVEIELQQGITNKPLKTSARVMRCERLGDKYGVGITFR
ncbi:MAG: MBL fold metallo-hydrolase [Terriglobales bacterium]